MQIRAVFSRVLTFGSLFGLATGSFGDNQKEFKKCYNTCFENEQCSIRTFPAQQTFFNYLLYWDCSSECKYRCMWTLENSNREARRPVYQYFGKWPFYRILGIQEFFSAIFSFGNLLAHVYGFHRIYLRGTEKVSQNWFLHGPVIVCYAISLNTWWWSTVFHSRDCNLTMYFDYFSAIALLLASLNLAIVRTFSIHSRKRQLFLAILLILFFVNHLRYMFWVKFDFDWNMKVAITVASAYLLSFLIWSLAHLAWKRRPHAKWAIAACLAAMGAALLEVNDFPPLLGLLDAHALWHAATIPIIPLWYWFYRLDALYDLGFSSITRGTLKTH